MQDNTAAVAVAAFVAETVAQFQATVEALGAWAISAPRSLAELEARTLGNVREVGQQLLAGVCGVVAASTVPGEAIPCSCGQQAHYQRQRVAQVKTVLGAITIRRAYYHCAACQHGVSPLDRQLGYCAGSTSAGLAELLALLGATADSFEAASALLEKLTLVHVSPNLARAATAALGAALHATEQQAVVAAWGPGILPVQAATPPQLCLSMDGVLVHTAEGWREYKLGSVYTTATRPSPTHPGQEEVYARDISYI